MVHAGEQGRLTTETRGLAMPNFIDRRLNPKDKSLGNRQRFLKRAREELKRSDQGSDQIRQDRDVDAAHAVSMPTRGAGEPTFPAPGSGIREHVLPGNKEFLPGDRIQAERGAGGKATVPAGWRRRRFPVRAVARRGARPVLRRSRTARHDQAQPQGDRSPSSRAGRLCHRGSPTNINIGRTMRNSFGRRMALQRPKRKRSRRSLDEIAPRSSRVTGQDSPT
jgi:uncharacterized sporulation protein YeaH/YhbH (DUF444 family)